MDDDRQPSIIFEFHYVNASVYTLQFKGAEGPLQVEGKALSGRFVFPPFEFPHNHTYVIRLRFVIDTDASVNAMKALIAEGGKIWFSLDQVHVSLQAKEDASVTGTLRIPQQWWRPDDPT